MCCQDEYSKIKTSKYNNNSGLNFTRLILKIDNFLHNLPIDK